MELQRQRFAAQWGRLEVAKILIQNGVNLNSHKFHFGTPLHLACTQGHDDIVKLLIDCGANLFLLDSQGYNVHQLATANEHANIVHMISMAVLLLGDD